MKSGKSSNKIWKFLIIVIIFVAGAAAGYFFKSHFSAPKPNGLAEAIGRFVESNKNKSDKTVNEEPPENVKTYTLYVTLDNSKIVTKKFSSAIEAIREVFYKSQKLKSFVLELDGRNTLIESNYRFMCESFGCNASVDGRIMLYGDESFRRFLEVQDLYEDFDTELYNIAVDY